MREFFDTNLIVLLKTFQDDIIFNVSNEQLYQTQFTEYAHRGMRSENQRIKFETITRDFQDQKKQFETRHVEIARSEAQKREEIIKNFEGHIEQIRQQMEEERLTLRVKNELTGENEPEYFENEITKENRML